MGVAWSPFHFIRLDWISETELRSSRQFPSQCNSGDGLSWWGGGRVPESLLKLGVSLYCFLKLPPLGLQPWGLFCSCLMEGLWENISSRSALSVWVMRDSPDIPACMPAPERLLLSKWIEKWGFWSSQVIFKKISFCYKTKWNIYFIISIQALSMHSSYLSWNVLTITLFPWAL